jgi:glycosyltransferase involved in cell wall biosynthesis
LPVITTDQAGAADLITPDNGLVIPAADPDAIAEALRWCLDNRDRLQSMRGAALEAARRRQWSHFRQDLMAVLRTRLETPGRAPAGAPAGRSNVVADEA